MDLEAVVATRAGGEGAAEQGGALAQSVDLSAFRILQEALTNVVKHAGRARTTVLVGYRADALELTVTDSGDGAPAHEPAPGGHGLVGMRERAALFGGTLTAGPHHRLVVGDHDP